MNPSPFFNNYDHEINNLLIYFLLLMVNSFSQNKTGRVKA